MSFALEIENLHKVYKNNDEALKGIHLRVEMGDFFALLGPNGAGKSTTIGIIFSLVRKTAGKVKVCGIDIDTDFQTARACMGLAPQEFNFSQFSKVFDIVTNQAGYYGVPLSVSRRRAEKYLTRLGLWEKHNHAARELSGGMKRRLMIARALVHEPQLLILDEPTAGVDIELRYLVWDFLRELNKQGRTIILTTHYFEEAESLCHNAAIISSGRIVAQNPMRQMLKDLDQEGFIFYLDRPINKAPDIPLAEVVLIDKQTLEISISKQLNLNYIFNHLEARQIRVVSMRNKANRLEQSFLSIVE